MNNVTEFLKNNPGSTKEAISEATNQRGIVLFNLLRKLQSEGTISVTGEGNSATYSLSETTEPTDEEQAGAQEETEENTGSQPESNEVQDNQPETEKLKRPVIKKTGKNNSKYSFNGVQYGKGPLVRAIVAKHVQDNPGITYDNLKEVFPDTLLKRFGIFNDVQVLVETPKMRDRYFCKEEQQIKLEDRNIIVCNQLTAENIQPFLVVARELGYVIE